MTEAVRPTSPAPQQRSYFSKKPLHHNQRSSRFAQLGKSPGSNEDFSQFSSVQLLNRSVVSDSLRPPVNHSTPGLPVHHQLLESTQTHAHRVGDAIQPSQPLSSPSPPAPNPSQHQGLFQ